MSSLPMLVRNARFGTALGTSYVFEDHIQRGLVDSHTGLSLPKIAEEVAKKYQIRREDVDEFALSSLRKWKAGNYYTVLYYNIFVFRNKSRPTMT